MKLVSVGIKIILVVFALTSAGLANAGGGDWKMGPFGPYWDDNDWPEYTPMYWMEEFMNQLDDDDDDILDWMQMNNYSKQPPYPNQMPYTNQLPGNGMPGMTRFPVRNMPAPSSPAYTGGHSLSPLYQPFSDPFATPYSDLPSGRGADRERRNLRRRPGGSDTQRLPNLSQQEYDRMPRQLQMEYERAFMELYFPDNYRRGYRGEPNRYRERGRSCRTKKSGCFLR